MADQHLFDQIDPLDTQNEKVKPLNIVSFPNYSSEVLSKLIQVNCDLKKLNCDKFDFISS